MKSACPAPSGSALGLMPWYHRGFARVLPTPWMPSLGSGVFSQLCQPPPRLLSLGEEEVALCRGMEQGVEDVSGALGKEAAS